ncbi:hypothetical protein PAPYR_6832 [Paratrimastix pyriformis]|uniref:Peptidase A2 domain-containing protein n=1 Tax=Paratrimastix pyriformis TaxID=342808 RepID=A0ABQ8UJY4_9EUKA|nr:hypothetical protein PAPYR_6832 [Paratrimastix pyriformis]
MMPRQAPGYEVRCPPLLNRTYDFFQPEDKTEVHLSRQAFYERIFPKLLARPVSKSLAHYPALDSEAAFDIDHPVEGPMRLDEIVLWERSYPFYLRGVLRDRSLLERTDYYGEQPPSTCSRELPTLWDFLLTGPLPLPVPVLVAEPEPVPESVPLPENVPVADDDEDEWSSDFFQPEDKTEVHLSRQAFYERIFPKLLASWFPNTNHLNPGLIVPVHFLKPLTEYHFSAPICVELHKFSLQTPQGTRVACIADTGANVSYAPLHYLRSLNLKIEEVRGDPVITLADDSAVPIAGVAELDLIIADHPHPHCRVYALDAPDAPAQLSLGQPEIQDYLIDLRAPCPLLSRASFFG